MAKRHLNLSNQQREEFFTLLMLLSYSDKYVFDWISKEEDRIKLKTASKLISEVIASTVHELTDTCHARIKNDARRLEVVLIQKPDTNNAKVKMPTKKNEEKLIFVEEALYFDLLEQTTQLCKYPCKRNYKVCPLRKTFLKAKVPKWDEEAKGCCPYEQRMDGDI